MSRITYEYGGTLHDTAAAMLDHFIDDYLSADGINNADDIRFELSQHDDETMIASMIVNFGLDDLMLGDDISEAEVATAMARYRAEKMP